MFATELFAGDGTEEDKDNIKLKEFLQKRNIQGTKNIDLLKKVDLESAVYGSAGARFLSEEDGIIDVPFNTYVPIRIPSKDYHGVNEIAYYAINTDRKEISSIDPQILGRIASGLVNTRIDSTGTIQLEDTNIIIVPPAQFVAFENVPIEGIEKSPLLNDIQRITFLINLYKQLNTDIVYDGPGRFIAWVDDSVDSELGVSMGGEITNTTAKARQDKLEETRKIITDAMNRFKNSTNRDLLVVNDFLKDLEHFPRTTLAKDLMPYLENEVEIACQLFGVPAQLLAAGRILGNISMEKIIDNSMIGVIIPRRNRIASKISMLLGENLDVGEIHFYAENYADKSRFDDARELSLTAVRASQAQLDDVVDALGREIIDVLERRTL